MRLLHTSDWHLGRSFHGHPTVPQLREVLAELPRLVREYRVDAVLVAGDVFDHAAPAADLYAVLAEVIRAIREAGAVVVLTSGNHDNASRLGFQAEWAALGGVHVLAAADAYRRPVVLHDEHGTVDVYGIPYLEPMLQRALYPGENLRTHHELLARVTIEISELRAARGNRSVVMAHCFAVNAAVPSAVSDSSQSAEGSRDASDYREAAAGLQRDVTSGGLDLVPASVFAAFDYAALGHLHGRQTLGEGVRYSGAPLHLSFSEAGKPRGAWLVELDAAGRSSVEWLDLPVPRRLTRLRGPLETVLTDGSYEEFEQDWVQVTLTDAVRPIDAMRRLRERFPFCAQLAFAPEGAAPRAKRSYTARVERRADLEVVDEFLQHVRAGEGASAGEREILAEVLAAAGTESKGN